MDSGPSRAGHPTPTALCCSLPHMCILCTGGLNANPNLCQVLLLPDNMSLEVGATLPENFFTVWANVFHPAAGVTCPRPRRALTPSMCSHTLYVLSHPRCALTLSMCSMCLLCSHTLAVLSHPRCTLTCSLFRQPAREPRAEDAARARRCWWHRLHCHCASPQNGSQGSASLQYILVSPPTGSCLHCAAVGNHYV